MSFDEWLHAQGLDRYADVFRANDVDASNAALLTDADLRELGLTVGHRRQFLAAIGELARTASGPDRLETGAERRQLTVLFCDLVGSVAIAERLDPEAFRAVLQRYRAACVAVIERYEGHAARFVGDGVLAYFGWPRVHEDDPARAVRAALDLVPAVRDVAPWIPLAARVGIATGPVVVGQDAGEGFEAQLAVGTTPNLAARLQSLAGPGEIVIAPLTRQLVGRQFALHDRGEHLLKGLRDLVRVWTVERLARVDGRFEAAHGEGALAPMIGRHEEVQLLLARWRLAADGEGQVVLLSGEAGIGKSRLVHRLRELIDEQDGAPHAFAGLQCSPYHVDSPLWPLIDFLERIAGIDRSEPAEANLDRLETALRQFTGEPTTRERMTLFAKVMSLPVNRYGLPEPVPQLFREQVLESIVALLTAGTNTRPLLVVAEDLHWADSTTRELLSRVAAAAAGVSILLVVTSRQAAEADLGGAISVTSYSVSRLTRRQSGDLVRQLRAQQAVPEAVVNRIVDAADGVPLFVEELARSLGESGGPDAPEAVPPLAIPPTLHDSLLARLDRLGATREVAQAGACIGREFGIGLLAAATDWPDAHLREALDRLLAAQILHRQPGGSEETYLFRHALVQDAAYQSLISPTRQRFHARIARALVTRFATQADAHPEIVAFHFGRAGLHGEALDYWQRAGALAMSHSAYAEAISHFEAALQLLNLQPAGRERDAAELAIRVRLGPAYQAVKGMASAESGVNYERACELGERLDRPREGFQALWGHWLFCNLTGRSEQARERAQRLLALSRELDDDEFVLQAHHARWTTLANLGDVETTRFDIEQGLRLYDPVRHGHHAHIYGGHDPGVCCRTQGAMCLWAVGMPDRAGRLADEGIALARQLDHPFSLAVGLWFSGAVKMFRDEPEACRDIANELLDLSRRRAFRNTEPHAQFQLGWSRAREGDVATGLRLMEEGEARLRALGQHGWRHICLAAIADVHARTGDMGRALERVNDAIDVAARGNVASWRPDFLRKRAVWMHGLGLIDREAAMQHLGAARKLARDQGALMFELRIRADLLRLSVGDAAREESMRDLAACLRRFGDGDALPDLVEARTLLDGSSLAP